MGEARLFASEDGWWYADHPKVAHLPVGAVENGSLVKEARQILEQGGFFSPRKMPFGLTVLTATSCNLGCPYCFQNTAPADESVTPFAPPRISRRLLAQDDVSRIATFAQERMNLLGFDSISLVIFGGEPLLNPKGCLALLKQLRPLGLAESMMISNCALLTPSLARQLDDEGLQRIQVSFDGHRADHDGTRFDRKGAGTYDRIMKNVGRAMQETSLAWKVRVNVSHHNLEGIPRLIDDLANLPIAQSSVSFAPALVDDHNIGYENHLSYENLADKFIEMVDLAFDAGLAVPVLGVPVSKCVHCSGFAGASGAVVSADGTLYSCWETAGKPEWTVGNISDGYLPEQKIKDRWVACDAAPKPHGTKEQRKNFYDTVDNHILARTHLRLDTKKAGQA
ncbi:4Fe-4S cluster-binding domain-containing protein (plasmid) [Streptomyces viridifaciens]|nr:4Fe-4S cluster-binding domain-containing protein [Streptomyces viridifaciens]UKZ03834.1 4Fe-4S cluster-binding domain-containing protein [Streptomyces viridifaciens]